MKQKPQKRRIFCGGKPTTKEHIWSEWMHPNLPSESDAREEFLKTFAQRNSAVSHERPGPVITKKIRAVCGDCNNGWMSRLETAVKPIILPMIRGDACTLDTEAQALLARWITMKAKSRNIRKTIKNSHQQQIALRLPTNTLSRPTFRFDSVEMAHLGAHFSTDRTHRGFVRC
jgi:hypothetical protein